MNTRTIQVEAQIDNDPETVINYIADPWHRPLYLPLLKAVDDVREQPEVVGTMWRWTVGILGMEFEGTGRCVAYEPGRLYRFETEGGIRSNWTYQAAPIDANTQLTVDLEYEVPEKAIPILPTDNVLASLREAEAERAIQNLKTILDR